MEPVLTASSKPLEQIDLVQDRVPVRIGDLVDPVGFSSKCTLVDRHVKGPAMPE